MSSPYTLTIFCACGGSPDFLRHLQQSNVNPLWIGEYPSFYRKYDPSNWPWSHAMLTEGHGVGFPNQCKTMQTWSFEINADKAFAPDVDSMTDDGSRNFDNKPTSYAEPGCVRTRRFCALNFLVAQSIEDEQKYKQHLSDVAEQHKELDIRIQLTGHISKIKEDLRSHSKIPKPAKPAKPSKKKNRVLTLAELEALDYPRPAAPSAPAAESPPPPPTFLALLSFPTEEEHKKFLELENSVKAEDGVKKEAILAKHLWIPPKDKKIHPGDWSYGNPHQPYGQDWFG